MNDFRNLRIERDKPGVMTVVIDMPDRPMNVLDEGLLRDLDALVASMEQDSALSLVVFRSGKESGFLAGADVEQLHKVATSQEAETAIRAGQQLFSRIADLPMQTVAVIHGPCLGGGLELALACKFRVARDDESTRIGLPETQLGVIPGWGGTQRLPRLIGLESALRMILEGQRLPAAKAQKFGLVDMVAPAGRFESAVQAFLTDRLAGKSVRRRKRALPARLRSESWLGRKLVFRIARKRLGRRLRQYPALGGALRAIEVGLARGLPRGLDAEREEFCRALFTPACRNLLELFLQRERARKSATWSGEGIVPRPVKTVAVVGAGTMGAGIAQLAAYQGLNVVLKDIRQVLVDDGLKRIESLMQDAVRSGSLDAAASRQRCDAVTGTIDWEPVSRADIVIEAVVERLNIKQDVFRELDKQLRPESLFVSNTSALPIGELATATGRAPQVAGLHFFNPVHRMAIVEIVRSARTSDQTVATLVEFARDLGKVPIVVAEGPGFLVNRILFPYLDEAVRLVCEGVPADQIDREAEDFGMMMGPLEMLDQVGIDIAADVARTMAPLGAEASPVPQRLAAMVAQGRLGRKSGTGFYTYRDGRKQGPVPASDIPPKMTRAPVQARFGEGEQLVEVPLRLALAIINASAECLADRIVREPWIVDLAMVLGTGFAPFRGGPLRLADTWGIENVVANLDRLTEVCGPRFRPCALLREMHMAGRKFFGTARPPLDT
jgi:3-hydroxyacyl-CoA dehydrogenase/enoyl-CoA hydratase/3-hydroxybutyryl-CoA epimerase